MQQVTQLFSAMRFGWAGEGGEDGRWHEAGSLPPSAISHPCCFRPTILLPSALPSVLPIAGSSLVSAKLEGIIDMSTKWSAGVVWVKRNLRRCSNEPRSESPTIRCAVATELLHARIGHGGLTSIRASWMTFTQSNLRNSLYGEAV
jgi:hypothetical protein